jgi:hypothetical protein
MFGALAARIAGRRLVKLRQQIGHAFGIGSLRMSEYSVRNSLAMPPRTKSKSASGRRAMVTRAGSFSVFQISTLS